MVSGIVCENGKSLHLMFILGQGIPSPHGVRFIIGIHQGFLPFSVGDGLFKDTSDGSACTAIIGDPIQAFALGKGVVIRPDPRNNHIVFAKEPAGHSLGEGR